MNTRSTKVLTMGVIALLAAFVSACAQSTAGGGGPTGMPPTVDPSKESFQSVTSTIKGQNVILQISSQAIAADGTLTTGGIDVLEPGWVVIYAENNGKPGDIIGEVAVPKGTTTTIKVPIDVSKATTNMYMILHKDAGEIGKFEFPGPDVPLIDDYNQKLMIKFRIHA